MYTGKIKWFNSTKGFGFITPDENKRIPQSNTYSGSEDPATSGNNMNDSTKESMHNGGQTADVFVHITALNRAGIDHNIPEGQRVRYEKIMSNDGRAAADNISLIED